MKMDKICFTLFDSVVKTIKYEQYASTVMYMTCKYAAVSASNGGLLSLCILLPKDLASIGARPLAWACLYLPKIALKNLVSMGVKFGLGHTESMPGFRFPSKTWHNPAILNIFGETSKKKGHWLNIFN